MTATVDHDALHTALEDALRRRFDDRIAAATAYGEEFAELWRTTAEGARGGKLLRPRLLVEVFQELAGSRTAADDNMVIDVATAIELLHYSFLLHDDVIDGDVLRRGRPNVIGALATGAIPTVASAHDAERAAHWGRTGAILMGDLLLAGAVLDFARVDIAAPARSRLLALVEDVVSETVAGELADVSFSDRVVTPDLPTILRMTTRKTAVYSFELPLRSAAILAGATSAAEEALASAGRSIGLAYQLQDDVLSVFGDPDAHGKDPHSDLREGKETAIIAYARMTSAWPEIGERFGAADLTDHEAAEIRRGLRVCGAEQFVDNLVAEQLREAGTVIDDAVDRGVLPRGIRPLFLALVSRLTGRRS